MWGAGNLDKMVSSILEPILKTSQFLTCGSKLSIADVYAFALISNEKSGKHSKFVKEWLKRCEPAIKTVKIQGIYKPNLSAESEGLKMSEIHFPKLTKTLLSQKSTLFCKKNLFIKIL